MANFYADYVLTPEKHVILDLIVNYCRHAHLRRLGVRSAGRRPEEQTDDLYPHCPMNTLEMVQGLKMEMLSPQG